MAVAVGALVGGAVAVAVDVDVDVAVDVEVAVDVGTSVGSGVFVGSAVGDSVAVAVGSGIEVGTGPEVGSAVLEQAATTVTSRENVAMSISRLLRDRTPFEDFFRTPMLVRDAPSVALTPHRVPAFPGMTVCLANVIHGVTNSLNMASNINPPTGQFARLRPNHTAIAY